MLASSDFAANQPRFLEHHEVFGNGIQRNREGAREFPDRSRPAPQAVENGAPGGVGEGREDAVQLGRAQTFNHGVEC